MAFGFDINNAVPTGSQSYYSDPNFQSLYNSIVGAAPQFTAQGTSDKINNLVKQFSGMYQNATGQAPSGDVINQMLGTIGPQISQSPLGWGGTNYADMQNLLTPYLQNTYGQQIQQNQQAQQTNQLQNSQNLVQNLVNQTMGNTAKQFSDPTSQLYQNFSGQLNNLGITPGSGAFQAGAGSTIANSGLNAANAGLEQVGLPQISGIAGTANAPYQMSLQNMYPGLSAYGTNATNQYDFNQQAALANSLSNEDSGNPWGAALQGGLQGAAVGSKVGPLGAVAGGAAGAGGGYATQSGKGGGTSYVCMELIKRDLLCNSDMDDFHVHIMPAMFKKARAFWKYAMDGKKLVDAANERGLDWKVFKPLLFDRVMEEPDPCKAVDLYADACHQLCISADPSLWDERVFRTSSFDSLSFLPRLFFYKPFLEALLKCIRIKMLIIYDKPICGRHYGS